MGELHAVGVADDLAGRICDAERDLLTSAVRQDARRLRELIHPDFTEIGRSGRLWTRSDLLVELLEEATRDTPHTDEWVIQRLDVDTVLVTYRLIAGTRISRHSSVWATSGDALALRFHQGTEQSAADARP
ncbi:DUF4440 domain-containing protein [Microbacterium sp. H37-C3]|uniref:nuclear transport factor 2 family protein n=1 Tax=Microbacterium sp. H37-C3 TaxID=3004354 RepID=UPI0022AF44FC|nr:DUF4440 domain-containing protein [Microbacterium sp. H37-C3]MCZ4066611.1 DUF4440 domain-containing protein [Microbacterium sp. H37-C3]